MVGKNIAHLPLLRNLPIFYLQVCGGLPSNTTYHCIRSCIIIIHNTVRVCSSHPVVLYLMRQSSGCCNGLIPPTCELIWSTRTAYIGSFVLLTSE